MKTRAAIAFGAGKPLEIAEVDLDGPRAGEVLVEVMEARPDRAIDVLGFTRLGGHTAIEAKVRGAGQFEIRSDEPTEETQQ